MASLCDGDPEVPPSLSPLRLLSSPEGSPHLVLTMSPMKLDKQGLHPPGTDEENEAHA